MNNAFPYTDELKLFQRADDAWCAELHRKFGKGSAIARWTNLGKGEEGSELRRLFIERDEARTRWLASATTTCIVRGA